jgi:uracil-DNA glycosylase family protein
VATQRSAADFLPPTYTLKALREAAAGCRGCDLYKYAAQTVFGEGSAHAKVMLVGEQPGDQEDRQGHPFVGPAGKLLYRAMDEAGLDPDDAYVTNAVKHFKFVERGKRRIHAKPKITEVRACEPWLEEEILAVKPRIVVALGATAAQALLDAKFRLTQHRGEVQTTTSGLHVVATVHPSSILRARDDETRHTEYAAFVDDLRIVAGLVAMGTAVT